MDQGTETKWNRALDLAKEIIFFILYTAGMFLYFMLVLLIISFVTTSFLHFTIEGIVIAAVIAAVCADGYYVYRKLKKGRRK